LHWGAQFWEERMFFMLKNHWLGEENRAHIARRYRLTKLSIKLVQVSERIIKAGLLAHLPF
jgi:hypothetical protein